MEDAVGEKTLAPVPTAGMPIKLVIVIALAALLIGLGSAVAFLKLRVGHPPDGGQTGPTSSGREAQSSTSRSELAAQAATPGVIYDLDPFIVNLADSPEIRYLKVAIKLELNRADAGAEIASRLAQVRDSILVLLTSKDSATVRSTQGKFQLRDEVIQRVNQLLPRPGVRAAYFTEFVVQ